MSRRSTKKDANNENIAACASEKFTLKFHLSARICHDAPEVRKLIESLGSEAGKHLLMDRVYEDDKTRALALKQELIPVVPPKTREYDAEFYK